MTSDFSNFSQIRTSVRHDKIVADLVLKLWGEGKLPYVDGLLLQDGRLYLDIRAQESLPIRSSIDSHLADFSKDTSFWEDVDIFKSQSYEDYNVYCGDAGYGSFGYVLVLTSQGQFKWLLFDEINPIQSMVIKDQVIYAVNNCDDQFILPIEHPENYKFIPNVYVL